MEYFLKFGDLLDTGLRIQRPSIYYLKFRDQIVSKPKFRESKM